MKIGLQNFQGIGAYTEIPIAPITLFYGPNSAGKSTVADAIEFISNTLRFRGHDWKNQLERHARRNRITLKKDFKGEPDDVVFTVDGAFHRGALETLEGNLSNNDPSFMLARRHGELIEALFPNYFDDADEGIKFEYQLFFSSAGIHIDGIEHLYHTGEWLLRKSLLFLNGTPFFRYSLPSFHVSRFAFNTQHPLWEILDNQFRTGFISAFEDTLMNTGIEDSDVAEISSATWQYFEINNPNSDVEPFGDVPIREDLNSPRATLDAELETCAAVTLINLFMKLPQHSMLGVFNVLPLRPIPKNDNVYKTNKYPNSMVCWESLAGDVRKAKLGKKLREVDHALPFVNSILTSRDFLDTGYTIDGDVKFQFSMDVEEFNNLIHLDPSSQQKMLKETPAEVHLYLVCQPDGSRVKIADVGVGISQVVPVLFGCWQAMAGCNVHIQQPELHLHPKLQAQLADVFIKCVSTPKSSGVLLLESHSEHLLLRLLRRIRESHMASVNRGEVTPGLTPVIDMQKVKGHELKAEQVSVVYVSKDESGMTKMKPLRLSDDGEFIDRWPNGFFTERDIELFGEEGPFA